MPDHAETGIILGKATQSTLMGRKSNKRDGILPMAAETLSPERRTLLDAISDATEQWSLASLSRALGRNAAYLHQYIHRQSPRHLPEADRHKIAKWLRIPHQSLRAPTDAITEESEDITTIPFFDIESAAGHASIIDDFAETNEEGWQFTPAIMDRLTHSGIAHLRLIKVRGDSMSPQLQDGDVIMIDLADQSAETAGTFVLDDGQGLVVKHLELIKRQSASEPQKIRICSMNSAYSPYRRAFDDIRIIGRVIWMARAF